MAYNVFDRLRRRFGEPDRRRHIDRADIDGYADSVPACLVDFWSVHGECEFAGGRLFSVNPVAWQPVVDEWVASLGLGSCGQFVPVTRSAFGRVRTFNRYMEARLKISALDHLVEIGSINPAGLSPDEFEMAGWLAASDSLDVSDYYDDSGAPLFDRAIEALGTLDWDEMYGFVPALPMGGARTLKCLQKVKCGPYLSMLCQMSPPKSFSFDIDPNLIAAAVRSIDE